MKPEPSAPKSKQRNVIRSAAELISELEDLPSLPVIYSRVCKVVAHPNTSAEDIGEVVSQDAGLTTRLLKFVNSGLYCFGSKIDTVSRAVALIGTEQLMDLTLATCVLEAFENLRTDLVDMRSFWRHSLACGVGARIVADKRGADNIEHHFVAGLLHDVGSLLMYHGLGRRAGRTLRVAAKRGELLHDAESRLLGFDHCEVGSELFRVWGLPDSLCDVARWHHDPDKAPNDHIDADVVHVADFFADGMEFGCGGERLVPPLSRNAWDHVGLPVEDIPDLLEEVEQQLEVAVDLMLGHAQG